MNIISWDGSFLNFCKENDKDHHCFIVSEFETTPSWVNYGFKFNQIDGNLEYQESEDEFDKKNGDLQVNEKKILDWCGGGYSRGLFTDVDVKRLIMEESKKNEKKKKKKNHTKKKLTT